MVIGMYISIITLNVSALNPPVRLIHVNVWQKLLQYCKVISLQLKNKWKKNKDKPGK